jgi:hypothetical protein
VRSLSPSLRCLSVCKPTEPSVVGVLLRFFGASGSFVAKEGSRLHRRKQNRYDVTRDGIGKASATCLCIIVCFATARTTTTTTSAVCFSACHFLPVTRWIQTKAALRSHGGGGGGGGKLAVCVFFSPFFFPSFDCHLFQTIDDVRYVFFPLSLPSASHAVSTLWKAFGRSVDCGVIFIFLYTILSHCRLYLLLAWTSSLRKCSAQFGFSRTCLGHTPCKS